MHISRARIFLQNGVNQDGPPPSYHSNSLRNDRDHRDRRTYDDLDDPNRVPTTDTLPPPLYSSMAPTDLPDNPNRYDSDQRDNRRRNSYGRPSYNHDSGDRGNQNREDKDQGWAGHRQRRGNDNRGDSFQGGRFNELPPRPRGNFEERRGDQGWRSNFSSNYHNGGGAGGRRAQGSGSWGAPPAGPVQGSSFGRGGNNNSWGASTSAGNGWGGVGDSWGASGTSGDWRNVGNASAAPVQESWTAPTQNTVAPASDWGGGDGWGTASTNETNNATADTSMAIETPTAQSSTAANDPWGVHATQPSSTAQPMPNEPPADAWASGWSTQAQPGSAPPASQNGKPSAATGFDAWNVQGPSSGQNMTGNSQSSSSQAPSDWWGEPAVTSTPNNPPPAQSDPWASGWSTQAQASPTPAASQHGQPSTATAFDSWNVQRRSSGTRVTGNVQSSSNQAPSSSWGEVRQSPPHLTPEVPAPRARSPEPAQNPMQMDSWPPPTSFDKPARSSGHRNSWHRSPSSHSPTPAGGSQPSPSGRNSQSQGRATNESSQPKRSQLYSKILPHCQRAIERDPSVPAPLKAVEASSLAVRLAVEKADVLGGLEEPALTSEMEKLLAAEKDSVNAHSLLDEQGTPMATQPTLPLHPQPVPTTVTSNVTSEPVLLTPSHSNSANPIKPVAPSIIPQSEAMQLDSDDSAVLARWTCSNQCSRATFAFSFNRSTPEGNSTVILVCRSPVRGAVDPYNEDGTWQVFTTTINRGTEREEAHLLPPLPQSSYRTDQDLWLDITENVQQGQNTVELKRMMLIGGLAGFTFEVKLISP